MEDQNDNKNISGIDNETSKKNRVEHDITTQYNSRGEAERRLFLYTRTKNIAYYILGIVESLLLFRLLLKLMAANPRNGFVNFIYSVTNVLAAPFYGVFRNVAFNTGGVGYLFEPGVIVAMLVYFLIALGIVKLLKIGFIEQM